MTQPHHSSAESRSTIEMNTDSSFNSVTEYNHTILGVPRTGNIENISDMPAPIRWFGYIAFGAIAVGGVAILAIGLLM
ncbi:hypothetical protein QE450_002729 [Paenibacillus sp. SORGH_AS306]|uniref:Uncharacterized protein n=1 Tax=Paenibacillus kyungheensis TaxID=1452732 RepID=A0AAX3LZL9_9BACL|nr:MULTISPECIES: hypothetical protein [Paenibacillus]MDQ1235231.1 hypothetical protein [Paenibacillus sp. SORGH_AS_0306]MDR6112278.1 hypothetical protein [Paenibacillus sp. SORGH_AS_0338]WCT54786.1 hypothetical protein PQ456_16485 [Paenibacillus kyungheensis]